MKKAFAFALLLLLSCPFALHAQHRGSQDSAGKVKVTGKLVEKGTNQPLEFATVTIQTVDNVTVNGGLTDAKGEYSIEVAPGTYNIKFDFISFKSQVIKNREISESTSLGTTVMEPDATVLNEVNIVAERSTVEIKLDKKVYNVGQDMMVKGGTASDVLDNVPSVSVDVDGNVSLRGNESVTILIDGRPSNMAGSNIAEVLRMLPADSVDKVEVITNPSARYDAEGGGGIINIILRKGKANGFNGSFVASVGNPDQAGGNATLNFRSDNFNLFSNFGYDYRDTKSHSFTNSEYFDEDGNTADFINEDRNNERIRRNLNGTFGMDWFLDKTLTWTNSVSFRKRSGTNPTDTYYDYYNADGSFDKTRYRYNGEDETEHNLQYSTYLIKKFNDDGHQLKIDASFSKSADDENAQINDIVLNAPDTSEDTYEQTINNEDEDRSLIQADYVYPFGKGSQFEAGYRGSFSKLLTDSGADMLDDSGNYVEEPNYTSLLQYKEKINALYAQFGSKFGKFSYLAGLRWEDSDIDVNLLNRGNFNNKKYNNFFPSAFLTYEFSEGTSASISYSRRINRPRGRWINPFSSLESNINIFEGNPDLNPSMTNAFEIGFMRKWSQLTFNTSAYLNATDDSFEFVRRVDGYTDEGTPITIVTPINLAKEYRFGFEVNTNYTPYRWWRINANFNFFRNETNGDYTSTYTDQDGNTVNDYQNFDYTAYNWFARINSKLTLPWKLDWQLNASYYGAQKNAQGRNKASFGANTALSKDLLKDKATLTLNVSDIFNSRKRRSYTDLPQVSSYSEFQWRPRQITLAFTYRFNMKKTEKPRPEEKQMQDDSGDDYNNMGG